MLHMVVNTHGPQGCPFRGGDEAALITSALDAFTTAGGGTGVEVRGAWASRAAHEMFVLVDAPDAHTVETALLNAGLVGRTHSRVLPVVTLEDVLEAARAAGN